MGHSTVQQSSPLAGSCPERGAAGRLSRVGGLCPATLRTSSVRLVGIAADAGDDVLLGALVQPLAAALDGAQELVEVDLERREDAVGPVLHLEARLACLPASLVDDLL